VIKHSRGGSVDGFCAAKYLRYSAAFAAIDYDTIVMLSGIVAVIASANLIVIQRTGRLTRAP
jgi:hypothetical protein